jgi:hypothetical protein
MILSPNPIPDSPQAWLEEIAKAYLDAYETIHIGPLVGQDIQPEDLFHVAPQVCLKFRGLGRSKALQGKVTDAALASYVANKDRLPEVFAVPQLVFAFSYLASHFGLELVDEKAVDEIMGYIEDNRETLLTLTQEG